MDDYGGKYLLPTTEQTRQMLACWRKHVTAPEFDFVYSWGSQRSDTALESELDLQDVFLAHNRTSGPLHRPTRHDAGVPPHVTGSRR